MGEKRGQHTMEAEAMDIELVVWTAVLGVLGVACSYLLYSRTSAAKPTIAYSTPAAKQVAKAEDSDAPPMLVLSGSQTGTAEDMSEKFAKEMKRHGFDAKPVDMEVYEMDGMELLADKKMEELGATRVGQYGEGDDDQDIEADYDEWKEAITPVLKEEFGCDCDASTAAAELEFSLAAVSNKASADAVEKGMDACFVSASVKSVIDNQVWLPGALTVKKELQTNSDRSTLHIEIKPTGQGDYSFAPGDHIGVRGENNPKSIGAIGTRLGLDLKQVVSLRSVDPTASKPFRFPCPCTIQVALSAWLDIETPARPEFLLFVARYASDAAEREELSKLGSAEGKEAYSSTIQDKRLNLIDLLDKFKSLLIPAGV